MRHVASKVPALDANGQPISSAPETSSSGKLDAKKNARKARKDGVVEENPVLAEGGAGETVEEMASGPPVDDEEKLEKLYEAVAWPLGKTYGHTYDAFKLALTWVPFD